MLPPVILFVVSTCTLTALSGCTWIECAVLCERFVGKGMHNPQTGERFICGGGVQKGEVTKAELDQGSTCITEHKAKGFMLDRTQ